MSSPDLQALQVCIMCNRISDLRNRLAETHGINPDEIPILFGGDFNGSPEHMSIQLAKRKILKADEIEELKYLYYTPTLEVKVIINIIHFEYNIKFTLLPKIAIERFLHYTFVERNWSPKSYNSKIYLRKILKLLGILIDVRETRH